MIKHPELREPERYRVYFKKAWNKREAGRYFEIVEAASASEAESIVQKARPAEYRVILRAKTVRLSAEPKKAE